VPFVFAGMYGPVGIEFSDGAHARRTSVTVFEGLTGDTLATLYTDREKSDTAPNPTTTDSHGNLIFYAEPGNYRIKYANYTLPVTINIDPGDYEGLGGGGEGGPVEWDNVLDKPTTFTPATHSHGQADITGLSASLAGKTSPADVTSIVGAAIDGLLGGAPGALDTLNELAAALGDDEEFATTVTSALAGKAPVVHTHAQGDITGLAAALADKADAAATTSALAGKAPLVHAHAIADSTGLQAALDAKKTPLSSKILPLRPRTPTPEVPTVTWATSTGYSGEKSIAWNAAASLGLIDRGAKLVQSGAWGINQPAHAGGFMNAFMLEFWHKGQDVAVVATPPAAGQILEYRLYVDGHMVIDHTQKTYVAGESYAKIAFASSKERLIQMVIGNAWYLGLRLPSTGYAYANPVNRFKCAIIGDSLTQGLTAGATGELVAASAVPMQIAQLTGWDVYSCGIGATGYVKDIGAGGYYFGSPDRLAQLATLPALDLIIIAGSANDPINSFTDAQVNTATTALLNALAVARPGTPIVVSGVQTVNAIAGTVAAFSASMKANALAHPAVKGYIDWTLPAFWQAGSGNSSAPNGTGNADIFIGPDNIHPTKAGAEYIARRTVAELARIGI
jgi:lysophospholipase L1-like esterase